MTRERGYTLRYSGRAFLGCLGMFELFGAFWRSGNDLGTALAVGVIAGAILLPIARRAASALWEPPTRNQIQILFLAIGLEMVAFTVLGMFGVFQHMRPAMASEAAFGVVAAHFLVMRWSHGPLMSWLGLSSLAWLGSCVLLHLPIPLIAIGDGLLKLGFGLAMAEPLLARLGFCSADAENGLPGATVFTA